LIVFVKSNPVFSDPRVEKEVQSLITYGFKVVVLAWDRDGVFRSLQLSDGKTILRLRLRAPYEKLAIGAYYPLFWFWIFTKLFRIRPQIVHACDLDSMPPALLYRLFDRRVRVIFDCFDNYALLFQAKNKMLSGIIRSIELLAASMADALITVSKERLWLFNGAKLKQTEVVMNCPVDNPSATARFRTAKTRSSFRIVYAGSISPGRGLTQLLEAIREIDDVEFLVAGRAANKSILDCLLNSPKVKYVGELRFDDSLALESTADLIPLLYDMAVPINNTATPNKLFEAMMLGVPIITNLPHIIQEVGCGLNVDYNDVVGIRQAISYLKNNSEARRKMGLEGRQAFLHKYNWFSMEKRLVNVYNKMLVG